MEPEVASESEDFRSCSLGGVVVDISQFPVKL